MCEEIIVVYCYTTEISQIDIGKCLTVSFCETVVNKHIHDFTQTFPFEEEEAKNCDIDFSASAKRFWPKKKSLRMGKKELILKHHRL